jgi:hypothetical protein
MGKGTFRRRVVNTDRLWTDATRRCTEGNPDHETGLSMGRCTFRRRTDILGAITDPDAGRRANPSRRNGCRRHVTGVHDHRSRNRRGSPNTGRTDNSRNPSRARYRTQPTCTGDTAHASNNARKQDNENGRVHIWRSSLWNEDNIPSRESRRRHSTEARLGDHASHNRSADSDGDFKTPGNRRDLTAQRGHNCPSREWSRANDGTTGK